MKFSMLYIAPHLSRIINVSFASGSVPDMLNIAKVCPIYKSGDKSVITNYRPISILPSFSKIYEKLGFRRNRCTCLAVLEMTEKIQEANDAAGKQDDG